MSEKRRDSKGRILRNGECQRKDGLYQYDYVGLDGKPKCVYSWKLEATDPLPKGKRKCLSLREKEREIQRNIDDGIVPYGGQLTVTELVKKYTLQKTGVKESTRTGYKTVINILEKDDFGSKRIDKVKLSDAKEWLIKLQNEDGRSYSSIHTIRGVLRPAFQVAVDDDLIRKNPFEFQLVSVIVNDSVTREAITHEQKRKFLDFVKNDKHFSKYYDGIYILFFTGVRISEFCGITLNDVDLKAKTLTIDHQLVRTSQMKYIIETTKTDAGKRVLPLQDEVCECFKRIIENRKKLKTEPMVDGKIGFLYFDKNNKPMVAMHWEKYFQHIVEKYNKIYRVQMPKVTPHICRHTYCSHNASAGMNPKHLQYLMGHSDIGVTLNTYTTVDLECVKNDVKAVEKAVL
ncbi:MAG: site-specific integrase [Eubacteriales bacterium]|nr:site-specific integrase [Eubacteriales bacterium]